MRTLYWNGLYIFFLVGQLRPSNPPGGEPPTLAPPPPDAPDLELGAPAELVPGEGLPHQVVGVEHHHQPGAQVHVVDVAVLASKAPARKI